MSETVLDSHLKFSYAPVSSYEFDAMIHNDTDFINALNQTKIYIIARRPLIEFYWVRYSKRKRILKFNLKRKDIKKKLKCEIHFNKDISFFGETPLILEIGSHSPNIKLKHGIKIYDKDYNFLFWASPEKLIYLHDKHHLPWIFIEGNTKDFMSFDVLYVGKCTAQTIQKRFRNGHHALMKILIEEQIINTEYDKSHEIVILPLEFDNNNILTTYSPGDITAMVNDVLHPKSIEKNKIALDVEKALINALDPRYNEDKYKNYPESKDGLFDENLTRIVYSFNENLLLKYQLGTFVGNVNPYAPDVSFIGVEGDEFNVFNIQKN